MSLRCDRCGRKITLIHEWEGGKYGPECINKVKEERRGKAEGKKTRKSPPARGSSPTLRPVVNLDRNLDGFDSVTANDVADHVRKIGFSDEVDVNVVLSDRNYYFTWRGEQTEAAATYSSDSKTITFYVNMTEASIGDVLEVFTHEYGHAVWYQLLDQAARREWVAMYQAALAAQRCITTYAETNVEEFFAESFMSYVHDPGKLATVTPPAYKWLRDRLFKGRNFGGGI